MKNYTHVSFSLGLGLASITLVSALHGIGFLYFLFFFIFLLLGRVNDWLDFKLYAEHQRKFLTHSPFSPILIFISLLMGILFSFVGVFFGMFAAIATHLIFIGHFFLDSLNPSGVPVMPKTKVRLNTIPYDSLRWNFLFFLAGLAMTALSFLTFVSLSF